MCFSQYSIWNLQHCWCSFDFQLKQAHKAAPQDIPVWSVPEDGGGDTSKASILRFPGLRQDLYPSQRLARPFELVRRCEPHKCKLDSEHLQNIRHQATCLGEGCQHFQATLQAIESNQTQGLLQVFPSDVLKLTHLLSS